MNIIFAYIDLIPFNYPNSLKMKTLAISLLRLVVITHKNIGTSGSVGPGECDSSHFPHIYDSTKTGGGRILSSSVLVVSHMTQVEEHVHFRQPAG